MYPLKNISVLTIVVIATCAVSITFAHEEQVLLVGRTGAGELHVHMDFNQPVELPESIFPGISGYAFGELAFHSTILDEPAEDLFQLSTAADFQLILIAKDAGMEVWNDTGSGYMGTNQTYYIGPAPFDNHPLWNIANGTPGNTYSLTLKLRDVNNVYPESDPFVLSFTPIQLVQRIVIQQVDSQHVALLWPSNAVNWELQTSVSITATNWVTVTNVPASVGTNHSVTINTTGQQQFFRLHKL